MKRNKRMTWEEYSAQNEAISLARYQARLEFDEEITEAYKHKTELPQAYLVKKKHFDELEIKLAKKFTLLNPGWIEIVQEKYGTRENFQIFPVLLVVEPEALKPFFNKVVYNACAGPTKWIFVNRKIFLRLDRDWIVNHIQKPVDDLLEAEGDDWWVIMRTIELLMLIERPKTNQMALELAQEAAKSEDAEIKEAGEDSLEWVQNCLNHGKVQFTPF